MTQYIAQTNTSLLTEGELGVSNSQLVAGSGSEGSYVVVGNPTNGTTVDGLGYAFDGMDVSSFSTLGSGFVFLDGATFDALGVGVYEFEESNGVVYGLYGRTDGIVQNVCFSSAYTNQSPMLYTTLTYSPPFLAGTGWEAECVLGSAINGFALSLRQTSGTGRRFLWVMHNGSLLDIAGHTYIEITTAVNTRISEFNNQYSGSVPTLILPRIVACNSIFFMAMGCYQVQNMNLGGWDSTNYWSPTNAVLPSSTATYSPSYFTVSTSGFPGGDISAAQFPSFHGSQSPTGNLNPYVLYDTATGGSWTTMIGNNDLVDPTSGWSCNMVSILEVEALSTGTIVVAFGGSTAPYASGSPVDITVNMVYTFSCTFTGSAGSYSNCQFNYSSPGQNGVSADYVQYYPFVVGGNPGFVAPNESVASVSGNYATCYNKLPICSYSLSGDRIIQQPNIFWYGSGKGSVVWNEAGVYRRMLIQSGPSAGSLAAAKSNKTAMMYPMFNVTNRFAGTTAAINQSTVVVSGIISTISGVINVGPNLWLTAGNTPTGGNAWVMDELSGTTLGSTTYNLFGESVPGFGTRTSETPVNLPAPSTTMSVYGHVWSTSTPTVTEPINIIVPLITDNTSLPSPNGLSVRAGQYTLSNGTYEPPPVIFSYSSSISSQVTALKATVLAVAQSEISGFGSSGVGNIMITPIIDPTGTTSTWALVVLGGAQPLTGSGWSLQGYLPCYGTPCTVTNGVMSLSNTSDIWLISNSNQGQTGIWETNTGSSDFAVAGCLELVYSGSSVWMYSQAGAYTAAVTEDAWGAYTVAEMPAGGGAPTSVSSVIGDYTIKRACSPYYGGLANVLYWGQGQEDPGPFFAVSRFSTSTVTTVAGLVASFQAAVSNINQETAANYAVIMSMDAINNEFMLQLGSVYGRLNHKVFSIPSTYINMSSYAAGQYYLYVTDTGADGIAIQADSAERPESSTNMYFGTVSVSAVGLYGMENVSEVVRFGTARLAKDYAGRATPGSAIRVGPYYQWEVYARGLGAANVDPSVNNLRGFNASGQPETYAMNRSYNLIMFDTSGNVTSCVTYDVFNATTGTTNAANLVSAMNAMATGQHFAVVTFDEPQTNQTATGMAAAFSRVGATIFGSTSFQYRSAYLLLGTVGSAKAYENYVGVADTTVQNNDVSGDPNAFIGVAFSIINGVWTVNPFNVGS
jgi:hypothetical protein